MSCRDLTRRKGLDLRIPLILFLIIPASLFSLPLRKLEVGASAGQRGKEFAFSIELAGEFRRLLTLSYAFVPTPDQPLSRFGIATAYRLSPLLALNFTKEFALSHVEIGANFRYNLKASWSIKAHISYALPSRREHEEYLAGFVGLNYCLLRFDDADRDGVIDEMDECPDTPKGARVDGKGCGLDSDGDGVFDGIDMCDNTPFAALVDSTGCPFDSDGDGVFDGVDICPGTPLGLEVDTLGCPLDEDGDGVPDFQDSCKGTPSGATVDNKGCSKDSDYDGIPDGLDKCPYTPTGFKVNSDGCPRYLPIEFEVIYDPLDTFGKLKPSLLKKLDLIALRIRAYPERIIELGGYTDSEGSAPYNKGRARRMVTAVKEYLLSKGVSEKNLRTKAYGEVSFIASNSTPEGRAKNRRVECKVIGEREDIKRVPAK